MTALPNPIRNDEDHADAIKRLSELMDIEIADGSAEDAEFKLLVSIIRDYEQTISLNEGAV